MKQLLDSNGYANQRINAHDGSNPSYIDQICKYNPFGDSKVAACACSHLEALKYFVKNTNLDEVLIFEDDVSFSFLDKIPFNWSEFYANLPKKWSVIQLAVTSYFTVPLYLKKRAACDKFYSCTAYLINRQAATKILEKYFDEDNQIYNLIDKQNLNETSETIIYSVPDIYSIPIFTYKTSESTIHDTHLTFQKDNKSKQKAQWDHISKLSEEEFSIEGYFKLFAK
jgi:GR25 family glycosyltransferase involved in LPS biosynthesis